VIEKEARARFVRKSRLADVDGTLLDSRTRSSGGAAEALALLAREQIPLVLCSSKTRAELEVVQQQLAIRHPFVCENGGGVFVPRGYFARGVPNARDIAGYEAVELGRPYAEVVGALHRIAARTRVGVIGFSDMSIEEVAFACDMPLMQARLAKLREYDEPFRILDASPSARSRLFNALHAAHLGCTNGGRYEHVGADVDKGVGVDMLRLLYARGRGRLISIGLGDALNDVALLRAVDVPIVVRNDDTAATPRLLAKVPTARVTSQAGVAGWAEAIGEVVQSRGVR